jgi:hypothetical protein
LLIVQKHRCQAESEAGGSLRRGEFVGASATGGKTKNSEPTLFREERGRERIVLKREKRTKNEGKIYGVRVQAVHSTFYFVSPLVLVHLS